MSFTIALLCLSVAAHPQDNGWVNTSSKLAKPERALHKLEDKTRYIWDGKVMRPATCEELERYATESSLIASNFRLAKNLALHGEVDEALIIFASYIDNCEYGKMARFEYAQTAVLARKYEEAVSILANDIHPTWGQEDFLLLAVSGAMAGHSVGGQKAFCDSYSRKANAGVEDFDQTLPTGSDLKSVQTSALIALGSHYQSLGQDSFANRVFAECLKLEPNSVWPNYSLGVDAVRKREWKLALTFLEAAERKASEGIRELIKEPLAMAKAGS